jgi:WhiB family redox-sensing transcriptional regulator
MWYPERGESARHAIDVCRTCPVRSECYTDALVRHENDGIWGGVSFNRKSRRDARLAAS